MLAMIRRRTSSCASSIQTTTSKATMCSFRRSPALRLRTESHGWTGPDSTPFSLYTPTMATTLFTCILSHKSGSDQVGFLALTPGWQGVQALQCSQHMTCCRLAHLFMIKAMDISCLQTLCTQFPYALQICTCTGLLLTLMLCTTEAGLASTAPTLPIRHQHEFHCARAVIPTAVLQVPVAAYKMFAKKCQ